MAIRPLSDQDYRRIILAIIYALGAVVIAYEILSGESKRILQVLKSSGIGDLSAVGGLLLVAIYFIPAFVASRRHHRNRLAIGVLNLLAGWTGVGWIAALVWACTADVESERPLRGQ